MTSIKFIFVLLTILLAIGVAIAMKCYSCNSLNKAYCTDPFDPPDRYPANLEYHEDCDERIGQIKRNQSLTILGNHIEYNGSNSYVAVCRKIVSTVGEHTRIHRTCGFYDASKEPVGCFEKTGSQGISILTCTCRGDFCNQGSSIDVLSLIPLGILLFVLLGANYVNNVTI